jgi:hypothetical protein
MIDNACARSASEDAQEEYERIIHEVHEKYKGLRKALRDRQLHVL